MNQRGSILIIASLILWVRHTIPSSGIVGLIAEFDRKLAILCFEAFRVSFGCFSYYFDAANYSVEVVGLLRVWSSPTVW
jgi:hypothetical protein